MKPIIIFLSLLFLISCSQIFYPKHKLEITKFYVGKYIGKVEHEKYVSILTTEMVITLKNNPTIPDSSWCYIKREPCRYHMHQDIAWQIEGQWLTWNGTEELYRLYKNVKLKR